MDLRPTKRARRQDDDSDPGYAPQSSRGASNGGMHQVGPDYELRDELAALARRVRCRFMLTLRLDNLPLSPSTSPFHALRSQ